MSFRIPWRTPYNEGGGSSTLVPHPWDCAIGGRTFMFDTAYFGREQMTRSSIKLLKPQQDSGSISEESLNPADGIRAAITSWHHGAGQAFLDREESDPYRFRSSKGFDPWTRHKLSLLPDTDQKVSSAQTNLALQPAGSRLYLTNNQTLSFTTDVTADTPSFTTVTSTPASAITGIASDGYTVWTAFGANGIYDTNTGASAAASRTTGTVGGPLGYVKGRLMAANTNSIYNVTSLSGAAAALPTPLFQHPNTDFRWVGFAEGRSVLYAAGYSGDKSRVYKTSIKADGTALDIPTVAGELPDGEIIRSIGSYLGFVFCGTDRGVWICEQDESGNLTVNKVVDLSAACYCFEGQGDFVWFGWTNYDSTSTGLGRMDLKSDTKGANVLTPAYASDLMATAQGAVLSVCTFQNIRVFAVSGNGIHGEATTKVASAQILSGQITHGLADQKVALTTTLTTEPLDGTVAVAISGDEGAYLTLGTSSVDESTSQAFSAGSLAAEAFELRLTAARDSGTTTQGPVVTRVTLESNAAPGRGEWIRWPLLMRDVLNVGGSDRAFDVQDAIYFLTDLETSGVPTTAQDVLGSATVTLEDHDFIIEGWTEKRDAYVGTFLASFRRPRRRS